MTDQVSYRWLDGPNATEEEWDRLEGIMAARRWASLNRATSRILLAEAYGEMIGYMVLQLTPYVGPLFVRPSARGSGVAEELADRMMESLVEIQARGWIVAAESSHAEKICVERGMTKVDTPIYIMKVPFGGVEV